MGRHAASAADPTRPAGDDEAQRRPATVGLSTPTMLLALGIGTAASVALSLLSLLRR